MKSRVAAYITFFALLGCRPPSAPMLQEGPLGDEMASAPQGDLKIGDQIIVALEKYDSAQGDYPEELEALVPNYLPKIESPQFGAKKWDYVKFPKEHRFSLFLWGKSRYDDGYAYWAPEKRWTVVHNSF